MGKMLLVEVPTANISATTYPSNLPTQGTYMTHCSVEDIFPSTNERRNRPFLGTNRPDSFEQKSSVDNLTNDSLPTVLRAANKDASSQSHRESLLANLRRNSNLGLGSTSYITSPYQDTRYHKKLPTSSGLPPIPNPATVHRYTYKPYTVSKPPCRQAPAPAPAPVPLPNHKYTYQPYTAATATQKQQPQRRSCASYDFSFISLATPAPTPMLSMPGTPRHC